MTNRPSPLDRLAAGLQQRYRLGDELGSGGMATVYLAHDVKHERPVAIKILKPELVTALAAERFLREIKVTASLVHPHILPLLDSGEAHGLLYFVMPYVDGETLAARLRRETQLAIDDALRIAREVAGALSYAHQLGIVHRDVKPANILLEAGHAVVSDFGIARAISEAGGERLTRSGHAIGTPTYMSPEQAVGEGDVDGRSDIFSLGCVLYEMLTGEPPFTGRTAHAVIAKLLTQTPADVSSLRDSVPRTVSRVVHKALAKTPVDRFASAADFAEELESVGRARSVSDAEVADKSIAVLPFANLSADPENDTFCAGIAEEIINTLAQLPQLRVAGRTSAFSFKGKAEDLRAIGEKLNVRTILEGSVRKSGNKLRITVQLVDVADGYHLWSERFDRELRDVFAIQEEIAKSIANRLQVTLAGDSHRRFWEGRFQRLDSLLDSWPRARPQTSNVAAYELYLKGRSLLYGRGTAMTKAAECFEGALALDPDYPLAYAGLADTYTILGYMGFLAPEAMWPRARRAAERALELGPELAESHNAVAVIALVQDWDWPRCEREFERALELNPAYVQARCWFAILYLWLVRQRYDDAIAQARRAVEQDSLSAYSHSLLGEVLTAAGHHEEGIKEGRYAVELDPHSYIAQWALGTSCHHAAQFPEAEAAYRRALGVFARHTWALAQLGVLYADWGKRTEAEAIYTELRARSRHEYVQPAVMAMLAAALDEHEEAIAMAHRACDERDAFMSWTAICWPINERLRSQPRFAEIRRRMGLE